MEDNAAEGLRVALGIDDFLDGFAHRHCALTWKQLVGDNPEEWKATFLDLMNDPKVTTLFNLDGVDIWRGVTRAAANRGTYTDWELLQIMQNPEWWPRIAWLRGDRTVSNPFV